MAIKTHREMWYFKSNRLLLELQNYNVLHYSFPQKSNLSTLMRYFSHVLHHFCACFPHIFFSYLFLFIFSLLICSSIPPPSSEPQALADVVMSYSSSTETWSCLCSLMQTSCQSNSSDTGAITCLSFCPFLCFFPLHSLFHLIHCEGFVPFTLDTFTTV